MIPFNGNYIINVQNNMTQEVNVIVKAVENTSIQATGTIPAQASDTVVLDATNLTPGGQADLFVVDGTEIFIERFNLP